MNEREPTFPVLCFYKGSMFTSASSEALTRTTSAALRGGLFNGLRIVDAHGREFAVGGAKKLHGIGPFWGFNIFLNQAVRVHLDMEPTARTVGVDAVRDLVLRDFRTWHGWESRADFEELVKSVRDARTVPEIMSLVTSERERRG